VAEGEALVTRQPISFYGGVDPKTGVIIDPGHELRGRSVEGKVLVFPQARGSTVGAYVLYGLKRHGRAPAAIVNEFCEPIVASGAILAGIPCVDRVDTARIRSGDWLVVDANRGSVEVRRPAP
jgi:hypothetical protein